MQLIEARELAGNPRTFEVREGNWDAVRSALEAVKYHVTRNSVVWHASVPMPRGYTKDDLAGFQNLTAMFTGGRRLGPSWRRMTA